MAIASATLKTLLHLIPSAANCNFNFSVKSENLITQNGVMDYKPYDFDLRSKYHFNTRTKHKACNTNTNAIWCHQIISASPLDDTVLWSKIPAPAGPS